MTGASPGRDEMGSTPAEPNPEPPDSAPGSWASEPGGGREPESRWHFGGSLPPGAYLVFAGIEAIIFVLLLVSVPLTFSWPFAVLFAVTIPINIRRAWRAYAVNLEPA